MPKLIDYLESARADNTGTSQMDSLLAENEISNMHTEGSLWADEPYDPDREIAEGAFMPIGARLSRANLIKKLKGERKFDIEKARKALSYIKDWKSLFKKGKEPDTRGGWGKLTSEAMYHPTAHEKKIVDELEHGDWDLIDKFKTGGEVSQSPYDFLETTQPDETAHTNMDKLIAEYGQSQQPQYSMREYQEPYDIAKEWGEGMLPIGAGIKLFRGVPRWFRGKMVKDGRHVSPKKIDWGYGDEFVVENPSKKGVWATKDRGHAKEFAKTPDESGYILEYDVPKKFYDDASTSWNDPKSPLFAVPDWFEGGIPKEYLKKVRKGYNLGGPVQFETAAQDETAHTNMDKLIAEYGQGQEPQYSMRKYQEPYDPARAIAEGSFMPVMGAIGVGKELTDKIALSARDKALPTIMKMIRRANQQWTKSKGPENRKVRNLAEKEASELGQLFDMIYDKRR